VSPAPLRTPQTRSTPPSTGDDVPELAAPTGRTDQNSSLRAMRNDPDEEVVGRGEDGPLLALPNLDLPRSEDLESVFDPQSGPVSVPATNPAPSPGATAQPPAQRRRLLSNLFGGLGLNWTRR
jgi:hypothetical protein